MSLRLNKNFIHFAGDVLVLEYTFSELVDLTTELNSITFRVKNDAGVTQPSLTKTLGSGITKHTVPVKVGDETINREIMAKVVLEPANTASLPIGKYTYQIIVTDKADKPIVCAVGEIDLRQAYRS